MSEIAENKIRKNWLYVFFVTFSLSLISYFFAIFTYSNIRHLLSTRMFVFMLILQLGFMIGWSFLYYQCAYKKPGRKLLAFNLIITPISYAYAILQKLHLVPYPKIPSQSFFFERSLFILVLAVSIVFYIYSLKLFKLNKELKKRLVKIDKD